MGLHYILQHLDSPGTYARILFVNFSLAFNTIIPDILHSKLSQLTVPAPAPTRQWVSNFLTDRRQQVAAFASWRLRVDHREGPSTGPLWTGPSSEYPKPADCREMKEGWETPWGLLLGTGVECHLAEQAGL
ncbi:hypothetical protein L3Q82_004647 [Scortum barcoo]|uniref:Uncharacterized protein n=1 Tax=Scortum barcoo TaxID=214431 RepID=A0ACB8VHI5_9TELE|nr:hypothetical protein L3Q82_004647 [Scortum barcoo]